MSQPDTTVQLQGHGPLPKIDPGLTDEFAALVDYFAPITGVQDIPAARAAMADASYAQATDASISLDGRYDVTRHSATAADGHPVELIVCVPVGVSSPPAIFNIHGGGMVLGDALMGADSLIQIAAELGAAFISVEYRLPPEYPHPTPIEDCLAGWLWALAHADTFGLDRDRIVLLGGSAGGGLAASLALLLRDRDLPLPRGLCLMQPMLDYRNNTISAQQARSEPMAWTPQSNRVGWDALLGDPHTPVSPYASPVAAESLQGLPPVLIDVGSSDMFRDEDVEFASRIWAAGGNAELHVWPGGFHGFDGFDAPLATSSRQTRIAWMRRILE